MALQGASPNASWGVNKDILTFFGTAVSGTVLLLVALCAVLLSHHAMWWWQCSTDLPIICCSCGAVRQVYAFESIALVLPAEREMEDRTMMKPVIKGSMLLLVSSKIVRQ